MPATPDAFDAVAKAVRRITAAWRAGTADRMTPMIAEQVVTVLPGFTGRVVGREPLLESFEAFAREAKVLSYEQGALEVDAGDRVAVAQYHFDMVYERAGARWRSTGWDVWVFERRGADWVAIWRTMQAVEETPAAG
jgi:ketosteroid isomerase-like protein